VTCRTDYQVAQWVQVGGCGQRESRFEVVRSPAQKYLGGRDAFLQLDDVDSGIAGSLRQVQINRIYGARAGDQFPAGLNQLIEFPITEIGGQPSSLASGIDAQQGAWWKAVRLSLNGVQNALFDFSLLSPLGAFERVDEIEWRQSQLIEAKLFRLQNLSGTRL